VAAAAAETLPAGTTDAQRQAAVRRIFLNY
jgi:hypothetical protein